MICSRIVDCYNNQNRCNNIEISCKSQIVSLENNKRYCLVNSDKSLVGKAHIDCGCIVDNNAKKCDYLLEFSNSRNQMIGVFVELKGSDFSRALSQIDATLDYYSAKFNKCFARIVCSSGARFLTADSKCIALKKRILKLGGTLVWFRNNGEEDILLFKS